jgi:hypothetical protein
MTNGNEAGAVLVQGATVYGIERHSHLFAAWAASRAASVKGCRFKVEQGRAILEAAGFKADFFTPDQLPASENMDEKHRQWRGGVIEAAGSHGLTFTRGVAAKLINIHVKCRFICGGHHEHERVRNLHPPIDDVLLRTLADLDIGGYAKQWREARQMRWSKLSSEQYEDVIARVRKSLKGQALWKIEEYWAGNQ